MIHWLFFCCSSVDDKNPYKTPRAGQRPVLSDLARNLGILEAVTEPEKGDQGVRVLAFGRFITRTMLGSGAEPSKDLELGRELIMIEDRLCGLKDLDQEHDQGQGQGQDKIVNRGRIG